MELKDLLSHLILSKPILLEIMHLSQAIEDENLMMIAEFLASLMEVPVEYVLEEFM